MDPASTPTSGPTRFGVVGLGFGLSRCQLIAGTPQAELTAVCARDERAAASAGERFSCRWSTDYHDLLTADYVDVVAVYTPSGNHPEIAAEAAAAGKHVIVSKPVASTLDGAVKIVDACAVAGVLLAVEFDTHYLPDSYRLFRTIAQGKFGKLVQGEYVNKCHRDQGYYDSDGGWRKGPIASGGGAVINQGIHALEQMLWYQGKPAGVFALAGTFAHDIEADDTASAIVSFTNGSMATFSVTTTFHNDRRPSRYGEGTMKRAEVNGVDGAATLVDDHATMWQVKASAQGGSSLPDHPPANVFEDVLTTLNRGERTSPTLVTGENALTSMRLASAIYESVTKRAFIEI